MENIVKYIPNIGDVLVLKDGEQTYIENPTKDFIDKNIAIGVVYDVSGSKVRIVNLNYREQHVWSKALVFFVTILPENSGTYQIQLNKTYTGNFTYTKVSGTLSEYASQLNSWFSSNAPDWSAHIENDICKVQYVGTIQDSIGYQFKVGNISYSGSGGIETGIVHERYCFNQLKQGFWVCGFNREQLELRTKDRNLISSRDEGGYTEFDEEYKLLDPNNEYLKDKLYTIVPLPSSYFESNRGIFLREKYNTYAKYLDACMVRKYEVLKGAMQYRNGKDLTSKLCNVKLLGIDEYKYEAAHECSLYSVGIPRFNSGDWWLPSLFELSLLMDSKTLNKVNETLSKIEDWKIINPAHWICSSVNSNWYYCFVYHENGHCDANGLGYKYNNGLPVYRVVPVTETVV